MNTEGIREGKEGRGRGNEELTDSEMKSVLVTLVEQEGAEGAGGKGGIFV